MFSIETEKAIYEKVQHKMEDIGNYGKTILEKINQCDADTAVALAYLYAYMPLSDIGNYPVEVLYDFAKQGVYLWQQGPFKGKVAVEDFLPYVLYHRINTEEIAPCRTLFYEALKDVVAGKTMEEAALAVNYWCAQEATYQSSDDRTLSALAVYETGSGRCGEESVFLANALRSVGIPARQVYAPKWSHCDDNHAWVEAYIDGTWRFLGACEPEEVLDKGWFLHASSRAMIVHAKWYEEGEKVVDPVETNGMVTMQNETSRYARTKQVTIEVVDEAGCAIAGAKVEGQIINYAEWTTIASGVTDAAGKVTFTLGLGALKVCARKEGLTTETLVDIREVAAATLTLTTPVYVGETSFEMIAPVDTPIHKGVVTAAQKAIGKEKVAAATAHRLQKVAAWKNTSLEAFLAIADEDAALRKQCVDTLSAKDRRDVQATQLEEHVQYAKQRKADVPEDIFGAYVLCPRIDNESLSCYRAAIENAFSTAEKESFREDPRRIWTYIKENIATKEEAAYDELVTTPVACLEMKLGSILSQKTLFVAIARTLGIPARINSVDKGIAYYADGAFVVVDTLPKNSVLTLTTTAEEVDWVYFQNWSIAKEEEGKYTSLDLRGTTFEDQRVVVNLAAGNYRILTANRLPNGNIFAKQYDFVLEDGEARSLALALSGAKLEDMLEEIALPAFEVKTATGEVVAASSFTEEGQALFLFLEESKEPTEHILNELMEHQEKFAEKANRIIAVVRSVAALSDPTLAQCLQALSKIEVYYDDFSEIIEVLGRRMYVDPDKLPLIFVATKGHQAVYATSGYNVGTAEMLLRILK